MVSQGKLYLLVVGLVSHFRVHRRPRRGSPLLVAIGPVRSDEVHLSPRDDEVGVAPRGGRREGDRLPLLRDCVELLHSIRTRTDFAYKACGIGKTVNGKKRQKGIQETSGPQANAIDPTKNINLVQKQSIPLRGKFKDKPTDISPCREIWMGKKTT